MEQYDHLYKGIDRTGKFRILIATTKFLSKEAILKHQCYPSSALVLTKALTATVLLAALEKDILGLTVKIKGSGPVGLVVTDVTGAGKVRGYIGNPEVLLERNGVAIDAEALGSGEIEVVKSFRDEAPFISHAPLATGDLAQGFASYFALSDQTPTQLNLTAVLAGKDEMLYCAGGYIVQALPGTSEVEIEEMSAHLKTLPPLSRLLHDGKSLNEIGCLISREFICLENRPLKFFCPCSREHFMKGIESLGKREIAKMIEEDGKAEVICRYCNSRYEYSKEDLEEMLSKARRE